MPKVYLEAGSTFTVHRGVGVVLASDTIDDAKIEWNTVIDLVNSKIDSNNAVCVGEFEGQYQITYDVYLEVGSNRLYYYSS